MGEVLALMLFLTLLSKWGYMGLEGYYPPMMENQMEKNMENEMETGTIRRVAPSQPYTLNPELSLLLASHLC